MKLNNKIFIFKMRKKATSDGSMSMKPKALLSALQKVSAEETTAPYQAFRGICNLDHRGKSAKYCYAISLFQLLLHSETVKNYFFFKRIRRKK